jgi:hypothetical protein
MNKFRINKTGESNSPDVMTAVAACRPSAASIAAEWNAERQSETLAAIIGNGAPTLDATGGASQSEIRLQFLPTHATSPGRRRSRQLSLAASFAVLAAVAGTIAAVVSGSSGGGDVGGRLAAASLGPAYDPPPGLADTAIGPNQYSYREVRQIDLDASGKPISNGPDAMVNRNWVSPGGDIMSVRTGSQRGCSAFPFQGRATFIDANLSFLASLPTDVDALNRYMRAHVQGSSSVDEAVFTAVGDALSTTDGLASPRLRAAFVGVLSRTPGVIVHRDVRDYLDRPAIRADFVNQHTRPGEVQSLYFDPTTFQLLEQRTGSNAQPDTYSGPSPAYGATASANADDPATLTGAAIVSVMTKEKAVNTLPTVPGCATSGPGD